MIKDFNSFKLNESSELIKIGVPYKIMQLIQRLFQIKKVNKLDKKNKTNIMNLYYKDNLLIIFNKEDNTWDIIVKKGGDRFFHGGGWILKRYDEEKEFFGGSYNKSVYKVYLEKIDLNNCDVFYVEKDNYKKIQDKDREINRELHNKVIYLSKYYKKVYPAKMVNIFEKKYYELRDVIKDYYIETTEDINTLNNLNNEQFGMLKNIGNELFRFINSYLKEESHRFTFDSFYNYLINKYNIQYKNDYEKSLFILEIIDSMNRDELIRGYSIYILKYKLNSINKTIERYKNINTELKASDYNI